MKRGMPQLVPPPIPVSAITLGQFGSCAKLQPDPARAATRFESVLDLTFQIALSGSTNQLKGISIKRTAAIQAQTATTAYKRCAVGSVAGLSLMVARRPAVPAPDT